MSRHNFELLWAGLLALTACGSTDQRKLTAMVRERMQAPSNLEVSEAVIYRDGDARMACITAQWDNQWGERQPKQKFIAWFIPTTKSWHTDNPRELESGPQCAFYSDPNWKDRARALDARAAADTNAQQDAVRQRAIDDANVRYTDAMARDAATRAENERQEQELSARIDAQTAKTEASYRANLSTADAALENSLKRTDR